MKKNMGDVDRLIRLFLAVVFAIFYFNNSMPGIPGVIFLILVGIFALTALFGYCLLYRLLGINTTSKNKII